MPEPAQPADDTPALTRAVARGDRAALGRLYESWFDRAYGAARRLTRRDEAFCLDVVQDAMLKVVRSIKPMNTRAELARWMDRVVHTAALDRLRAESRRAARERGHAPGRQLDAAGASALAEQIEWVRGELTAMSVDDRSLLSARIGQGRTLAQAGSAEGLGENAAHGRVRRALRRLRDAARRAFP